MIEYTNGQFGSIAPAKDIIDMLSELKSLEDIKAVHMGSVADLQAIRQNKTSVDGLHERLSQLEKEIDTLKPKGYIKTYQIEDMPK